MTVVSIFEGKGNVITWAFKIKAKLIEKDYEEQLLDANKPLF